MFRRVVARVLREAGWWLDELAERVAPQRVEVPAADAFTPSPQSVRLTAENPRWNAVEHVVNSGYIWGCGEGHVDDAR